MLLHTEAFTQGSPYILQDAFTQSSLDTQKPLHTQKLLRTDAFTHRRFYTQKLLHTDAFTHRSLCAEQLLHREALSQKSLETQQLLHRAAFTRSSIYTQKPLYRAAFRHRSLYTPEALHRQFFTQSRFYKKHLSHRAFTHRRFSRLVETLFRLVETRLRLVETRSDRHGSGWFGHGLQTPKNFRPLCDRVAPMLGNICQNLVSGTLTVRVQKHFHVTLKSLHGRPPWGHVALMLSHMGCQKTGFASPDIRKSYVGVQNSPEQPTCHSPQKPKGLHGRHLYVGPYELPKIGFANLDVRKSYIGVQNGPHVMLRKGPKASIASISGNVASMLGHMSCQ